MLICKVGGRLEVGGWLPVSLTELGHWHGFIVLTDDGAVSIRRPQKRKQKEKIVWGPLKKGEKGRGVQRAMAQRGKRGCRKAYKLLCRLALIRDGDWSQYAQSLRRSRA